MSPTPPPLTLEILDETRRLTEAQLAFLARHGAEAARLLRAGGAVRVRVVGDEAMAQAHEEFGGVPGTTDVLTFDLSDPEEFPNLPRPTATDIGKGNDRLVYGLDTDILVCIDEGERQAGARGYAVERELLLYIIHGVLHCVGFDDHDEAESVAMHEMEDALLTAIGVGPVFRTG